MAQPHDETGAGPAIDPEEQNIVDDIEAAISEDDTYLRDMNLQHQSLAVTIGSPRGTEHIRLDGPADQPRARVPVAQMLPINVYFQLLDVFHQNFRYLQTLGLLRPLPAGGRYLVDYDFRVYVPGAPSMDAVALMSPDEIQNVREALQASLIAPARAEQAPTVPRLTATQLNTIIDAFSDRPTVFHRAFGQTQRELEELKDEGPTDKWGIEAIKNTVNYAFERRSADIDLILGLAETLEQQGSQAAAPIDTWYPQCVARLCGMPAVDAGEWPDNLRDQLYIHAEEQAGRVDDNLERFVRSLQPAAPTYLARNLGADLRTWAMTMTTIPESLRVARDELVRLAHDQAQATPEAGAAAGD